MNGAILYGLGTLILCSALGAPAYSQDAQNSSPRVPATQATSASDESGLAEIVVSARKQDETVLRAPVSVAVVSTDMLAQKDITQPNQLGGVIPGLTMVPGANGVPGVSIRGLGSNATTFSLEPSVALFIDGVYLGHPRDFVTPLFDLDHIEMIQGTQSTLLGKNTSLGAISILTKRPTDTFGYDVSYLRSFETDGNRLEGALNVPINSIFAARIALYRNLDDGYTQNAFLGGKEPQLGETSERISVSIDPTTNIDSVLIYQHDDRNVHGQLFGVIADPTHVLANRAGAFGQTLPIGVPYEIGSASEATAVSGAGPLPYDREQADRTNFILNAHLGDYTITSQSAYVDWNSPRDLDYDFTAANLFDFLDDEHDKVLSQELRLSSPRAGRFAYLIGAYYYYNPYSYFRSFVAPSEPSPAFPLSGTTAGRDHITTTSYSLFGSDTLEIVDNLKLETGVRYTHEKKSADFERASDGVLAKSFPTVPFLNYDPLEDHPVDYNVGLDWQASQATLLYASFSKGSKSGGFQDFPTTPAGAPYKPETAYSTELGAKWNLSHGAYATAALFNTRVKDFQTAITEAVGTPPVAQQILGNSDVRSRGFQLAGSVRPVDDLRLNASALYAQSIFTNDFPDSGPGRIASEGDTLTRAPKWSGNLSGDYSHHVADSYLGFVGLNFDFASKALLQFETLQPDAPYSASHETLDARIGLRDETAGWSLTLLATNLTDRQWVNFATTITGGGTGVGTRSFLGSYSPPRIIGLQFEIKR